MSITLIFSKYKYSNPNKWNFVQIKHWGQTGLFKSYKDFRKFTYSIDTGLPSVWKVISEAKDKIIHLNEAAQKKIMEIIERSTVGLTPKEQLAIWKNLTKGNIAYANGRGWDDGYADYIQKTNLDKEGIGLEPIITSGSTLRLLEKGPKYSKIWAYDLQNNLQGFLKSDPWTEFWGWMPAVISRDRPVLDSRGRPTDDIYEEIFPFPRTEKIGYNYIYMPFVAWGKNYQLVENTSLRFMTEDEVYPAIPLWNWAGMKSRSVSKERIAR